jgi:hypothetical protein
MTPGPWSRPMRHFMNLTELCGGFERGHAGSISIIIVPLRRFASHGKRSIGDPNYDIHVRVIIGHRSDVFK